MGEDQHHDRELKGRRLNLSEVRLHVVEAGPEAGYPVVLLHGFPEFWYGWREQIGPLAERGCRVVVPDQRGYNRSGKPRLISAYTLPRLATDIVELLDTLGLGRVVVAGHDWGGEVAWWLAMHHPGRVKHLVAFSAPHPYAMEAALRTSWRQRLWSSYMLFFQIPWLAERALTVGRATLLARAMQRSRVAGAFSQDELERYRRAWGRPGAMRAMLNWYRALLRRPPEAGLSVRVSAPTTVVWGEKDPYFEQDTLEDSLRYCRRAQSVRWPGCGHWVQHEAPVAVTRILAASVVG